MELERKQDLSVYYWLKSVFSDAPFVRITDGFPEENLTLPTVSFEVESVTTLPFELGNRHREKIRVWYVDIFAETMTQRNEMGYKIINALDENIEVNNYDEGFPPNVSPSKIGILYPTDVNFRTIKVIPELTEKLYYRAVVSFTAEYTSLGG